MRVFAIFLILFVVSGCSKNVPEKTKGEIRQEQIKIISNNLIKKYKAKDILHDLGQGGIFTVQFQDYLKTTNDNLIFREYNLDDIFKDDNNNYWLSFGDFNYSPHSKLILKTDEATAKAFIKSTRYSSWIVIARINKVKKTAIYLDSKIDTEDTDTDDDNKANLDDVMSNVEIDTSDLFILKGDFIDAVEIK